MSAASAVLPALAPDPVLPHRDRLLDPERAAHRLRAAVAVGSSPDRQPALTAPTARAAPAGPAPTGGRVQTLRVRYQPGRSVRVTQRLWAGPSGSTAPVLSTRGVAAEAFERLVTSSGASTGPGTGVTADPGTCSVSWLFPHDRRLAALPDVWHRTGGARDALGPAWATTELAALAPEKTATLRCRAGTGSVLAYAKVYATPEAAAGSADRTRRAAGPAALDVGSGQGHVPAVLALVPDQCTVLLGEVDGEPLSGLPLARLAPALDGLAAALARLHSLSPGGLPPLRRFRAGQLVAAAEAVAAGAPHLAALAHDVAAVLAATLPAGPTVLVHGDAHLPNALLTASGVALIDFDEAAAGHPAADIGGILAGLRRARLAGTLTPPDESTLAARFLGAYTALAGPLDDDTLTWYVGAALLVEGAARGVRRVQPATLRLLGPLLDEALGAALPVAQRRRRGSVPVVPAARRSSDGDGDAPRTDPPGRLP